jgi:hypothetical protein
MNKLSTHLSIICYTFIAAFALAWCMVSIAPKFMTCRYLDPLTGEAKNTWCIQRPHVRQSKPATAEPTETATPEWATATDEPFYPWSTATPYETSEPYPTQERTPYP